MLEVCIDSLESAVNSIHGGADELEVCSSLTEGGLTPSPGLVIEILKMVNCYSKNVTKRPKINVMIRCRSGSDFCYTPLEMDTMLADIEIFKSMNVDRVVFGALTDKQEICDVNCSKVIAKAFPIPVTFHRAFDVAKNPISSIEKVIDLGFTRLLTSGQSSSAANKEGFVLIQDLLNTYGEKIEIMAGAGVNSDNAKMFIEAGCKIVHSSCKVVKHLPHIENGLSMGTGDSEILYITDENIVRKLKDTINNKQGD